MKGASSRQTFLVPAALVLAAVVVAAILIAARPEVEQRPAPRYLPLVRVVTAQKATVVPVVRAYGTVEPTVETNLVPEVAGRVVWVSPDLAAGGFVDEGQVLLRIDPADYEIARDRAEAALLRARSQLEFSRAQLERTKKLHRGTLETQAKLEEAENAARAAEAAYREAEAALRRAKLDLERTELKALFAGRIRSENVDVGQYVSPAMPVARLYASDAVEIELPIPPDELAFLDVPLGRTPDRPVPARIYAELGGRPVEWVGRIVRTAAEIDPKTRVVTLVARVDDPFHLRDGKEGPPLLVGLFVEAEIEGRPLRDVVVLPRTAMRDSDRLLVVDDEDRLRIRKVEVIRTERDRVLLGAGVKPGERVCVTLLEVVTDGMRVRVAESEEHAS
ncbi:MAG: RND superfamily efflux pump MFP component [Candidatus Binatia bacterium]|nr:MAG: RND superfamily efflux pump MFP component [Candidatus Binatia bacterium]